METLRVNLAKSLFSSNLTKEVEIEDPNSQEGRDLDLNHEENMNHNATMFRTTSKSFKTWT